ncbi:MAG: ABC transporter permease [Candidatus Limnocylindria bacterium]
MNRLPWIGGLFPNAYYVARREFDIRVRTRTFAVVTILLAIVGAGLTLLPVGIRIIGGDKPTHLAVYATDGQLASSTAASLELTLNALSGGTTGSSAPKWEVRPVTDVEAARAEVRSDKLDGLLSVSRGADGDLSFDAFSKAAAADQRVALVRTAANQLAVSDRLSRAGISLSDQARISAPASFKTTAADPETAKRNQEDLVPAYILATVFVILMFMAIQVYGNWVAASVAEEKSNRVMELLISAATPRQLLLGKVLGNGAAGLAQYAVILVAAVVGFAIQSRLAQAFLGDSNAATVPGLTPVVFVGLGVFFLAGFTLYSILYAAAGSMVSRQEDIQQIVAPLTFVGIGGYLISLTAVSVIDASWVRILSFVPFVSPFIFPQRMLLSDVAPWEYVVVIGLTLLAILGALWVAARIYEAGVLLYGQRPTVRTMVRVAFSQR